MNIKEEKWIWLTFFITIAIMLFLAYMGYGEIQQYNYIQTEINGTVYHQYDVFCNTNNIIMKDIRVGNVEIPCRDYPNQIIQFFYSSFVINKSSEG